MSFAIIKNAGPPPASHGGLRAYPIPDLDVGDAFDVPHKNERDASGALRVQNTLCNCIRNHTKSHPEKKFTTRAMDDVVRVYRVA